MASRDDKFDKGERVELSEEKVEEEEEVKEEKKVTVKAQQSETIKIVSLRNMKINYTGKVSGKLYVFNGAGAVVDVDVEDAEIMVNKQGGQCCQGTASGPSKYFAKV